MKIRAKTGREDISLVYVAEFDDQCLVEFVEAVQPPLSLNDKWVLIISSMFGCPVKCKFCDAGNLYKGKLNLDQIIAQIDFLVTRRFPDRFVPVKKFKIQFARTGEPSLNNSVLAALSKLPEKYDAPGLLPTLSTIAPKGTESFFDELLSIKKDLYDERFQLQFSIHSSDRTVRDWLIPVEKWGFRKIAEYGKKFYGNRGRKITLNFSLAEDIPVEVDVLKYYFDPDDFIIKITPVNPTFKAAANNICSMFTEEHYPEGLFEEFRDAGYQVIPSLGELEENLIGSNCGQHITNYIMQNTRISEGYTYPLEVIEKRAAPGAGRMKKHNDEIP